MINYSSISELGLNVSYRRLYEYNKSEKNKHDNDAKDDGNWLKFTFNLLLNY